MNIKRILFWLVFVVFLGLIIWGVTVAVNRPVSSKAMKGYEKITELDHVKGLNGVGADKVPVTLIEYSDFQCPACQTYYYFVKKLMEESSTTVNFVYRHFPLSQHANAMPSAMASEAAGAQDKFWEMYTLIFENTDKWVDVSDPTEVFVGFAEQLGLNIEQFKNDLQSSTLKAKISADMNSGTVIGLKGTPTFFVNGQSIANPPNYEQFKKIIDAAAEKGTE